MKAQIGAKDTTGRRRRPHPHGAERPRRAEDAVAVGQRRRRLLAGPAPAGERTQLAAVGRDPGDGARREPPGCPSQSWSRGSSPRRELPRDRSHPRLHLRRVRRPRRGPPGALGAPRHRDRRNGRRPLKRRRRPRAQVVPMHGSSRGDRLPTEDVEAIRQPRPRRRSCSSPRARRRCSRTRSPTASPTWCCSRSSRTRSSSPSAARTCSPPRASSAGGGARRALGTTAGDRDRVLAQGRGRQVGSWPARSPPSWARQGRRTLLVDLDLQFGDVAIMMGVEPERRSSTSS